MTISLEKHAHRRPKGEVKQIDGKRVASPEYRSWQMMRNRCNNPRADSYAGYGGAGISVCDAWEDFDLFLQDMGRRPTLRHSLERKDARGNYDPGNCIWADKATQSQNRPGFVKLSMPRAMEIRRMYGTGKYTHVTIAALFGIGTATVGRLLRKESWVYE